MKPTHFTDRLDHAIRSKRAAAVVGLDPILERLPPELRPAGRSVAAGAAAVERFSREVVELVAPRVPAVKINSAFFEAFFEAGVAAFFRVIAHAHAHGLLVISDVKRGDIGSTAQLYARGHLEQPAFEDVPPERMPDAVTLAGYLGENAVAPFIDAARRLGRGVYVLVRPSDPGADRVHNFGGGERFYEHMARLVHEWGARPELLGDCGLSCVGAVVAPKDEASTRALRAMLPHTPFLVPGYGAQGAAAQACAACFGPAPASAVVNASRSVIFAYEQERYAQRFGSDWRACIAAACDDFVSDLRAIASG
jgi:orotidine-5'-phosphate decarboxylase